MNDTIVLYDADGHKNVLLEDQDAGEAVQANHHVIVHNGKGMVLDPGGHKVYRKVLSDTTAILKGGTLSTIFLSHQDPDIVAAINGWLLTSDAVAYCSALWTRFVPHFGLDRLVIDRLKPIPDEGMLLNLGGCDLLIIPAHFLHSPGNFQVYDPISKILYSGDLGASLGMKYRDVPDFDAHLPYMDGFHRRYMASGKTMRLWASMVRQLDIEVIAPQHGALFRGPQMVERFLSWCEGLSCGVDHLDHLYKLPGR